MLRGATPVPTLADFGHEAAPRHQPAITATDLGHRVAAGGPTAPGSTATNADAVAAQLVANVRGCEFGTGVRNAWPATAREGQLGDIFHSNPVVVGQPVYFNPDPSYRDGFKGTWRTATA